MVCSVYQLLRCRSAYMSVMWWSGQLPGVVEQAEVHAEGVGVVLDGLGRAAGERVLDELQHDHQVDRLVAQREVGPGGLDLRRG